MANVTKTDPLGQHEWALDDEVIQLREWGTDRSHPLPQGLGEWTVGSAGDCAIRLVDAPLFVSRYHAKLARVPAGAILVDAGSKNGIWLDDARRHELALAPGIEVGIGSLRLIAESERSIQLREFLGRLLGWSDARRGDVDRALRAMRAFATLRAPLVLHGEGDLVLLARQLHDRAIGPERPFVVADSRRMRSQETSRSAESRATATEAVSAALGGTLCVWSGRFPDDFADVRDYLADRGVRVRLIVCARDSDPPPDDAATSIVVPPLSERANEIDRIIDEYAADAIAKLGAKPTSFTAQEHHWLRHRRPRSVAEVARATERLVAIREYGGITKAAARLGITHVALSRWLERRR